MGLLEFAAEAVHDAARSDVEAFEFGVGYRGFAGPAAGGGFGVGGDRLPGPLLLEFAGVLFVDLAQLGAGAGDGLGGGGQRGLVGGGGVVRALHLVDQVVEFGDVRLGGGVGLRRPGTGQAVAVRPEAGEVLAGEVADLAPAGDVPPVLFGLVVLHAGPHVGDVHQVPVGEAAAAADAHVSHGSTTGPGWSGPVGSVNDGDGAGGVAVMPGRARARSMSATRAAEKASASP